MLRGERARGCGTARVAETARRMTAQTRPDQPVGGQARAGGTRESKRGYSGAGAPVFVRSARGCERSGMGAHAELAKRYHVPQNADKPLGGEMWSGFG